MNTKYGSHSGRSITLCTTGEGRSFSRFVLPFGWSRTPCAAPKGEYYYSEIPPAKHIEKRKYFTRETGDALYKRAKWLELRGFCSAPWAMGQPIIFPDGSKIQARLECPRLALFEWDTRKESDAILRSGFLVIDVYLERYENGRPPMLDDLLTFNDFFRYIDCPYDAHYQTKSEPCFRQLFRDTRTSFVHSNAEYVGAQSKEHPRAQYFERWAELLDIPVVIGNNCYRIVSRNSRDAARNYIENPTKFADPGFLIYADNRTYVWTAASLGDGVEGLQALARSPSRCAHDYGHWIKLLNIDKAAKCPSSTHSDIRKFEREWAESRTYHRWEEWGTWYGFTYHSGAALMKTPGTPNFVHHFSTFYFDIVLLLFYLRVSLFRFSAELGVLSSEKPLDRSYRRFQEIRGQFANFTIRYQFPILSNQQQAIEMYSLARQNFDIKDLYDEVKSEIHETHEYLEMLDAHKLSRIANKIAVWGIPFGVAALGATTVGLGLDLSNLKDCIAASPPCSINGKFWLDVGFVLLLAASSYFFVRWQLKKMEKSNAK